MKSLILVLVCLLLSVASCGAAAKEQQLQSDNQQVEEIEKYIASLRQRVANYYEDQLIEVKQRAEAEIRLLEIADKPVYASLAAQAEVAKTVLNIDNYGYRVPWNIANDDGMILQLANEHKSYIGVEDRVIKSSYPFQRLIVERKGEALAGRRFAAAHSLIAERKSRILAMLEQAVADFERQKMYTLTVALPELEERLKQNLTKPEAKPTHGLVTGIIFCANPSAIIDRQIVHEGDVIYGVKVVKISKDNVKFSRKSKDWEQKVQQSPEDYWK
jgi:hypothetical protein